MATGWIGGIPSVTRIIMYLVIVIAVFWGVYEFFFADKRKWPHMIQIKDITGGGIRPRTTRGGWKVDKSDMTGFYTIKGFKETKLKHPPLSLAHITDKGKMSFDFVKFGPGPFDFGVLDWRTLRDDGLPKVIPLADINWGSYSVKKAQEKNALSGWLSENKQVIIGMGVIAFALIVMISTIQYQKENIAVSISYQDSWASKQVEASENYREGMEMLAKALGQEYQPASATDPPPGYG